MTVVLHRGPIPTTTLGHHWFEIRGFRYAVTSGPGPDCGNAGYAYVITDENGQELADSCATLSEVRVWAEEEAMYTG